MGAILEAVPYFYYYVTAPVVYLAIFFLFRNRSAAAKTKLLWALCAVDFVVYFVNDYYFYKRGDGLLTMLPLQLCNIAVFLMPLSLVVKKRVVYDFLFHVCALGALIALVVPSSDYVGQTYSYMTISFFAFHSAIVAFPLLLAGWGFYAPAPTVKSAAGLSAAVLALAVSMHLLNLALGRWFGAEANYFFTIIRYSAPRNPAFALFAALIPVDLIYLAPALPILWLSIPVVSLPWLLAKRRGRAAAGESVAVPPGHRF